MGSKSLSDEREQRGSNRTDWAWSILLEAEHCAGIDLALIAISYYEPPAAME